MNFEAEADDRQTHTHHTRAKVVLAHVGWLLQCKGINEIGGVGQQDGKYVQKFKTKIGVPVEVSVTPEEPTRIEVHFHSRPRQHYKVETLGDDGKTMDISVMCNNIAGGIHQIASAFREDPVEPEDSKVVHRTDIQLKNSDTSRSKSVPTRPHVGNVTAKNERSDETQVGRKEKEANDETESPKNPPQLVSQLTSVWVRCGRNDAFKPAQPLIQKAIDSAKGGMEDLPKRLQDIVGFFEKQASVSPRFERISGGIVQQLAAIVRTTASQKDARSFKVPTDEKNSALARLRAVQKPESVLSRPYKGDINGGAAQKFIGSRKRTAMAEFGRSRMEISEDELPKNDDMHSKLSVSKQRDFQSLIVSTMRDLFGENPSVFYNDRLNGWTIATSTWAATCRVEIGAGGEFNGWTYVGIKKDGQVQKVASRKIVGIAHDSLALRLATYLGDVLRPVKWGKQDVGSKVSAKSGKGSKAQVSRDSSSRGTRT